MTETEINNPPLMTQELSDDDVKRVAENTAMSERGEDSSKAKQAPSTAGDDATKRKETQAPKDHRKTQPAAASTRYAPKSVSDAKDMFYKSELLEGMSEEEKQKLLIVTSIVAVVLIVVVVYMVKDYLFMMTHKVYYYVLKSMVRTDMKLFGYVVVTSLPKHARYMAAACQGAFTLLCSIVGWSIVNKLTTA